MSGVDAIMPFAFVIHRIVIFEWSDPLDIRNSMDIRESLAAIFVAIGGTDADLSVAAASGVSCRLSCCRNVEPAPVPKFLAPYELDSTFQPNFNRDWYIAHIDFPFLGLGSRRSDSRLLWLRISDIRAEPDPDVIDAGAFHPLIVARARPGATTSDPIISVRDGRCHPSAPISSFAPDVDVRIDDLTGKRATCVR